MSGSVNKVIIIGNCARDPETRNFANGGKVCNLTVVTNETWRDKQTGERKERAEFHKVAIFNEVIANNAERYLKKGSKVYVEGKLETRKWQDQSGQDRYSTEVTIRPFGGELTFLDPAGGGEDRQDSGRGFADPKHETAYRGQAPADDLDGDDLPF
ncbi:single-stranded DNA-binding protein [Albimonas pacifica]|uniref:Single-stranded DNA-binding protein n=1 Tax=Albimonas pacifica TaxID=1114924 RepID=A0A1I3LGN8_9RHOB|nr:single-stranded DNA-binding protein [Albimonas pacifica]SFI83887.1 single-strand binding protein [Albimonas pacifica]